ncbi:hypothetical protein [Ralstonia chuxiongensis]|uniref:Uncharacterized protein n=1 Tax=Ralstonia chuxiongensis TaxID=2957504 RepID=A0AA41WRQ0_9RALS|nr:hypothetical protein [Ralstonia chuxiongensis]MCP1173786.1 hypothetical protein [Ralstonia chuxiongensis]
MKLYFVPVEHEETMMGLLRRMNESGSPQPGQVFFVEPHEMAALLASHIIDTPERGDIAESHLKVADKEYTASSFSKHVVHAGENQTEPVQVFDDSPFWNSILRAREGREAPKDAASECVNIPKSHLK